MLYTDSVDSGVRSAAGWAWAEWRRQKNEKPDDFRTLDQAGMNHAGVNNWYVNSQKQSYAIIRDRSPWMATRFVENESVDKLEPMPPFEHEFAIATHEVTASEFDRFLQASDRDEFPTTVEDREQRNTDIYSADRDGPINSIVWYNAVAYCNWLSKQDGIPPDDWCYTPNQEGRYDEGMTIKTNFLELPGYRLPTREEWEFACRAGGTTQFGFGEAEDYRLISRYAWWRDNSHGDTARRVGLLRPNRFGLFDTHGNLWELTNSRNDSTALGAAVNSQTRWVRRGGYFKTTDPFSLGLCDTVLEGEPPGLEGNATAPLDSSSVFIRFRPCRTRR
jgi:hypothetical protein